MKLRLGGQLESPALRGDGVLTIAAAALAVVTLLALAANSLLDWWWADPSRTRDLGGAGRRGDTRCCPSSVRIGMRASRRRMRAVNTGLEWGPTIAFAGGVMPIVRCTQSRPGMCVASVGACLLTVGVAATG